MKKVFILLFAFIFSQYIFSQISDSEKNALVDVYTSTNGDSWRTSWDLNSSPTIWNGVTIENNKVTELNLGMNNLNGFIPKSIGNLKNLKVLDLGFNKLNGEIPSEIVNLENLKILKLFMNKLEGKIPSEIGNLVHL